MQEEELGRVGGRTDHKVRQLRRAQRCVGVAAGARVERGRGGQRVRVVLDDGRCARPDSGVHGRSWGGVLERGGEVAEPAAGGHGLRGFAAPGVKSAKRFSGPLLVCCLGNRPFSGKVSISQKANTAPLRPVWSGCRPIRAHCADCWSRTSPPRRPSTRRSSPSWSGPCVTYAPRGRGNARRSLTGSRVSVSLGVNPDLCRCRVG
jgi:hypothetical protein